MTYVIVGVQRDIRPWQCIPLPFGNDYAHTVFVSSMFTLSVTEADFTTKRRQPLRTSVQISKSMRFRTHVYWAFFLFWWILSPLKILKTFNTCIGLFESFC